MHRLIAARTATRREDGFTLIELLVVIIIIGILAAIAIPVFLNQRVKGYDSQAKSDLRNLANFEEIYLTDFGTYGSAAQIQASEPSLAISKNDTLTVVFYNGVTGYCLSAQRLGSPNTWYYDSSAGGLQPLGKTCTAITSGTAGGSITG
jgi:prepilin-type N-terminal cleavage/methylation domain-containing protein